MIRKNEFYILLYIPIYFLFAWGLPWPHLEIIGFELHSLFLFDFFYIILAFFLLPFQSLQEFMKSTLFYPKIIFTNSKVYIPFMVISFFALINIFLIKIFSLKTPFQLIQNGFWTIVILAPIVEEFLFRLHFPNILKVIIKNLHKKKLTLFIDHIWASSFLFSFSHSIGIWILPQEYRAFVILQLLYTLILGRILMKLFEKYKTLFVPILGHIVFNFIFYLLLV
jgi:membrane protease YdiL (CAAX protease family)